MTKGVIAPFKEAVVDVRIQLKEPLPEDAPVEVGQEIDLFDTPESRYSLVRVTFISEDRRSIFVEPCA